MSLNCVEIDFILKELDLGNSYLENVFQPTYEKVVLLFRKKSSQNLLLSLEGENTRLHQIWKSHPSSIKLQRFAQLLRSRLIGSQLNKIHQVDQNRLILMEFFKEGQTIRLWSKLWGNQANLILTNKENKILDCFFRRPAKGEISGKLWTPPPPSSLPKSKAYNLRFEVFDNYNRRIEEFYDQKSLKAEETQRKNYYRKVLKKRLIRTLKIIQTLKEENLLTEAEKYKLWGNLLLSYCPSLKGKNTIQIEREIIPTEGIEILSELTKFYFKLYKKSKEAFHYANKRQKDIELEIEITEKALEELESNNWETKKFEEKYQPLLKILNQTPRKPINSKKRSVGLIFKSGDFTILVGRNEKENDLLLRKYVKSQDMWLHLRNFPSCYVFIKNKNKKTFPLEVLLDAGMLTLFFSCKRKLKRADLCYTLVKYLRRVKEKKLTKVISTKEKNLSVTIEEDKLQRLLENKSVLSL